MTRSIPAPTVPRSFVGYREAWERSLAEGGRPGQDPGGKQERPFLETCTWYSSTKRFILSIVKGEKELLTTALHLGSRSQPLLIP